MTFGVPEGGGGTTGGGTKDCTVDVTGVTLFEVIERPDPARFVAVTENEYVVPFVRPVIVAESVLLPRLA